MNTPRSAPCPRLARFLVRRPQSREVRTVARALACVIVMASASCSLFSLSPNAPRDGGTTGDGGSDTSGPLIDGGATADRGIDVAATGPMDGGTTADGGIGIDGPLADGASEDDSTSDGGAVFPDGGLIPSPAFQAYLNNLLVFRPPGGSLDLDGDGTPDLVVTFDSTGTMTVVLSGATHVIQTMNYHADGTIDGTADRNEDGTNDYTYSFTGSGDDWTETELTDTHMSGTYDQQTTNVFTNATHPPGMLTRTFQTLNYALSPPAFATVSTSTGPAVESQTCHAPIPQSAAAAALAAAGGGPCTCYDQTFDNNSDSIYADASQSVQLYVEGSSGIVPWRVATAGSAACSPGQILQIARTLQTALTSLTTTLTQLNKSLLADMMARQATQTWLFGCAPSVLPCCSATLAQSSTDPGLKNTLFNPSSFVNPVALQEIIAHEMMHAAGFLHANGDEGGNSGRDYIYSCARQSVPGCRSTLHTTRDGEMGCHWYNSRRDCAACAGTTAEKASCGDSTGSGVLTSQYPGTHFLIQTTDVEYQIATITLPDSDWTICELPPSALAIPTCFLESRWSFCDATPIPPSVMQTEADLNDPVCGITCPPGYSIPQPLDTCAAYSGMYWDTSGPMLCNGVSGIYPLVDNTNCGEAYHTGACVTPATSPVDGTLCSF